MCKDWSVDPWDWLGGAKDLQELGTGAAIWSCVDLHAAMWADDASFNGGFYLQTLQTGFFFVVVAEGDFVTKDLLGSLCIAFYDRLAALEVSLGLVYQLKVMHE